MKALPQLEVMAVLILVVLGMMVLLCLIGLTAALIKDILDSSHGALNTTPHSTLQHSAVQHIQLLVYKKGASRSDRNEDWWP